MTAERSILPNRTGLRYFAILVPIRFGFTLRLRYTQIGERDDVVDHGGRASKRRRKILAPERSMVWLVGRKRLI
jgi:hypothetical protein